MSAKEFSRKLSYTKLMAHSPYKLDEMTNTYGQLIEFYEHPTQGDEYPVIAACHELQLAANTEFFELDDMTDSHGEYQPVFVGGELHFGNDLM